MGINFTFFIQGFHFLVAYFILEKFLLRPIVKALRKEQKEYTDLITTITTQQKLLEEKEKHKQAQWNTLKRLFAQVIPPLGPTPSIPFEFISQPISITKQKFNEYKKNIQETLITRLSNVS